MLSANAIYYLKIKFQMNSTLQAKLHYDGKPHQKKVSMFLNQSVKKVKTEDCPITTTSSDWSSYCDVRNRSPFLVIPLDDIIYMKSYRKVRFGGFGHFL